MTLHLSFPFSQSSLQDYLDCPRRFELRYLRQLQWPAVESEPVLENECRQPEGQLFHRLGQQHLPGIPLEKLTSLASSPTCVARAGHLCWASAGDHAPDSAGAPYASICVVRLCSWGRFLP